MAEIDVDALAGRASSTMAQNVEEGTLKGDASSSLFEEFYDDWGTFDAAVAAAIALHHPIRKRSSLTFEVYNRTVSKGAPSVCIHIYIWKTTH